jgi:hypothetical protein
VIRSIGLYKTNGRSKCVVVIGKLKTQIFIRTFEGEIWDGVGGYGN